MKTYRAKFTGREVNAIGIFYHINTTVQGNDEKEAELNLYDKYEHISGLTLTEEFPPLTAYRITYQDGSTSETSMAAGVTLDQAREYFIGKYFNLGVFPIEKMVQAVKVEAIPA